MFNENAPTLAIGGGNAEGAGLSHKDGMKKQTSPSEHMLKRPLKLCECSGTWVWLHPDCIILWFSDKRLQTKSVDWERQGVMLSPPNSNTSETCVNLWCFFSPHKRKQCIRTSKTWIHIPRTQIHAWTAVFHAATEGMSLNCSISWAAGRLNHPQLWRTIHYALKCWHKDVLLTV